MQCITCNTQIDPKWRAAIKNNRCPFCGAEIMDSNLQELLSSLTSLMECLKEYPEALNDWLLSNHNYIKTDSENLINYIPKDMLTHSHRIESDKDLQNIPDRKRMVKVMTDDGEIEVLSEKIQSDRKTSEFFKRAEVIKTNLDGFTSADDKTKKLRDYVKKINNNSFEQDNSALINAFASDSQETDLYQNNIKSAFDSEINFDVDNDIPEALLKNAKSGNNQYNAKDLMLLKQMQEKMNDASSNISSGANVGKKGAISRVS